MTSTRPSLLNISRAVLLSSLFIFSCFLTIAQAATAPGGFWESDETTQVRASLTPSQIAAFMPTTRGSFTFPSPWNTTGIRVTQPSDCGGNDCVELIYNLWRNMSNSVGSNTMYIFVGLSRGQGGQGPTLFKLDKTTDQLTDLGPLFSSSNPLSSATGEGWFFSYSMPTKLYINNGSKLQRYDVLTHTMTTVFDTTTKYPNTIISAANASDDDNVFSATLEDASTYNRIGCVVYTASTGKFIDFPAKTSTGIKKCMVDKSGKYVLINEKTPGTCSSCDLDTIIGNTQDGSESPILYNQDGGGGHYDVGYGHMVLADNWASEANAWRLWDMSQPLVQGATLPDGQPQGGLVHHNINWSVDEPGHVSWENSVPGATLPVTQQYGCGGAINSTVGPRANEVQCFRFNTAAATANEKTFVLAPAMSDLNATGGNAICPGCENYAKQPKGNIDPTGQYFLWETNLGGSRLNIIMVKVPCQTLLAPLTPPAISITAPGAGNVPAASTVSVAANVSSGGSVGVMEVQFQLDGKNIGSPVVQAPYSIAWNTSGVAAGSHALTAIAYGTCGVSTTSSAVGIKIPTSSSSPTPPNVSITDPAPGATVSGTVSVTAKVSSSSTISSVQFQLDGKNLGSPVTQSPYQIKWDTSNATGGQHELGAIATDASGLTGDAQPITVTVSSPASTTSPAVSITQPAPGATVSGTVTVAADVSSNSTISKVQFKLDGKNLGSAVTQSPYQVSWDTTKSSTGQHELTAVATTDTGTSGTSSPDDVTVSNGTSSGSGGTSSPPSSNTGGNTGGAGGLGPFGLLALFGLALLFERQRRIRKTPDSGPRS